MHGLKNLLISSIVCYFLLIIPFITLYKQSLFELYILKSKKSPEEKLNLAMIFKIPASKVVFWNLLITYTNTTEEYYKQKILEKSNYIQIIYLIIFANIFLVMGLGILVVTFWRTLESNHLDQIIISLLWLLFGVWRYVEIISFYKRLKAEDKKSKNSFSGKV